MIRLLLVDDQVIIRQGLKNLLESIPDFQVVGDAENGEQAIAIVEQLHKTAQQPDVVLLDVRMPVMDGVATTRHLCQQFPALRVLMLTTFDDDEYVSQAMRYGAKGYLLKQTPIEELAVAIQVVYQGYTHLGPGLFEKTLIPPLISEPEPMIPPEFASLTLREREILCCIAMGHNNREIATTLHLSESTVRNYITQILRQLHLRDRTQAALFVSTFPPKLQCFEP